MSTVPIRVQQENTWLNQSKKGSYRERERSRRASETAEESDYQGGTGLGVQFKVSNKDSSIAESPEERETRDSLAA